MLIKRSGGGAKCKSITASVENQQTERKTNVRNIVVYFFVGVTFVEIFKIKSNFIVAFR